MRWLFAFPPLFLLARVFFRNTASEGESPRSYRSQGNSLAPWLFVALAFTLIVMLFQPMNFDEHGQLVRALGFDPNPPSNHWLARVFSRFGVQAVGRLWVGARLPSILFSFFTIALWYFVSSLYLSRIAATWFSAALFANGLFLFNAVSSRAYSLGMFLTTALVTTLVSYTETKQIRWATLSLASLALLLGLGGVTHRMLYLVSIVIFIALLFWSWQRVESRMMPRLAGLGAALFIWLAWPYLWGVFDTERESGLFFRTLTSADLVWNRLESISFLYVFGWDRSWQALLGFAFVTTLLAIRLRSSVVLFGEYYWVLLLLALPAIGWGVGNLAWEPRFFIFFLLPGVFFLAQSLDAIQTRLKKFWWSVAFLLFVFLPLFQAPRLFMNSGGQMDLVKFLDVAAKRYSRHQDSCLSCSGSHSYCRWVKNIYLPPERGFAWSSQCAHPWVVRITGNDQNPMPPGRWLVNFGYGRDYLLYEPLAP